MKKFLPLILLLVGVIVLVVAFFLVRSKRQGAEESVGEEIALLEVPLEERPVVALTPTSDGHYLKLRVEKIIIPAASLEYELLYQTKGGITQGVPGTVDLGDKDSFETELLLGSESSGKFRYDEGVEEGTLTLRFRNEEGKLLVKFSTAFHLQTGATTLTTIDGGLEFSLEKPSKEFFVVMETLGIPKDVPRDIAVGPYGIFSSEEEKVPGRFEWGYALIYRWGGSEWLSLENFESDDIGIFVASP